MDYLFNYLTPNISYFIERQCSSNWQLSTTRINFYDITYIVDGCITYEVDGMAYKLKKGDVIYIKKGSHRQTLVDSDNPARYFATNFDFSYSSGPYYELPFPIVFNIQNDIRLISLYGRLKQIWLEKDDGYQLQARAMFILILHRLINYIQSKGTPSILEDKRIQKAKTYILENYHTNIEILRLAEDANLNPLYFSSLFKKQTGFSPMAYLQRIRIHMAETLLSMGGYTVSEVCYRCGFKDPFHFSKTFKKLIGKSPSSYLKET